MPMSDIKFSIITVSLNSGAYIEDTIQSVAAQTYHNREHIIIDGASTDATRQILEKHDHEISWVSEADDGIADAMNKGIARASGDYLLFINADDYLRNEHVLEEIGKCVTDKLDLYVFQVIASYPSAEQKLMFSRKPNWLTHLKMGSCHQGQLISRRLFEQYGLYDTTFRITMDYDFLLRCYQQGISARAISLPVAVMRQVGISARRDWPSLCERFAEERRVHFKYADTTLARFIYQLYWQLYPVYRRLLYWFAPRSSSA